MLSRCVNPEPNAQSPAPLFPNAQYVVQADEWDFWRGSEARRNRTRFEVNCQPLQDAGVLLQVHGHTALTSEVVCEPCVGHTAGHQVRGDEGTPQFIIRLVVIAYKIVILALSVGCSCAHVVHQNILGFPFRYCTSDSKVHVITFVDVMILSDCEFEY